MHPDHMDRLLRLRLDFDVPMRITSGFRDPSHPAEVSKRAGGEHTTGRASDVAIQGPLAIKLISLAYMHGFTRIGVQQKGGGRFIHLGDNPTFPPGIWSY